jgi:hypothetical protein
MLTRHKKRTPDSLRIRGFYRLLPQLVGSSVRAAGCRGMGAARMEPLTKCYFTGDSHVNTRQYLSSLIFINFRERQSCLGPTLR